MNVLPPELRDRLRGWAERPPRRDAATAARLARNSRRRYPSATRARLAWVAATLAMLLGTGLGLVATRPPAPALADPPTAATPTSPAVDNQIVVIELDSGTSLYVVLPPPVARRSS
jgi:hypothetical protein